MALLSSLRVGIVAPSFQVPQAEFELGLEKLREENWFFKVHPQCRRAYRYFAGTDEERAQAFFEYAQDPSIDIVWCARGGYGAARILPYLERLVAKNGLPPRKLLAGYSDSTALLEYVRSRWGWSALHSPMAGLRSFRALSPGEWKAMRQFFSGESPKNPWGAKKLRFATKAPSQNIEGELVGGNLSVWASMIGTPFEPVVQGKFVFFEDVDESLYRLDRMAEQVGQSGMLSGAKGIILGNFLNCTDKVSNVLAEVPKGKNRARVIASPKPSELEPARKKLNEKKMIPKLFGELGDRVGIPVAYGLPVGHGPAKYSLPLGAKYRLSRSGGFELLQWDWRPSHAPLDRNTHLG
ncbi:MAG: hypothetical protein A2X94_01470 [Bdellovibrionales bacterium GWB1_55_8]|nr:MAG: hypothetical protein A2X94_01470 [Bdellovibrionales bacterium GWB1_55_8]